MQTFKVGDKVKSTAKEVDFMGMCWVATVVEAIKAEGTPDGFCYETVGLWHPVEGKTPAVKPIDEPTLRSLYSNHLVKVEMS